MRRVSVPSDRTPSQAFALTLGRLRALVRQHPTPIDDALALGQEAGRRAYAAGRSLTLLVEIVAGLVPEDASDVRTFPGALMEAVTTGYLDAQSSSDVASPDRAFTATD